MAYEPTVWENREVERPRTYVMTQNDDGTVTLTPSEGEIFSQGTPLDAVNLNKIEQELVNIDSDKVGKEGADFTGPISATVINATSKLQEKGVDLESKYAQLGSYVTWGADPNGVFLNVGTSNGKQYKIFLTSAQPSAGGTGERRVWIQTDS